MAARVDRRGRRRLGRGQPPAQRTPLPARGHLLAAPLALIADTDGSVSEAALWRRQRTCWERAVELSRRHRLAIPYEHTTLPGYFFGAGAARTSRVRS